jgi:hypothetical protein
MKKLLITLLLLNVATAYTQNIGINEDGSSPNSSAILDVKSTDKGLLIPRVQLDDVSTAAPITAPVEGLLIYNETGTEPKGFYYWNGTNWIKLTTGNATGPWESTGSYVYLANPTDSVGIGTTTPTAELDVSGTVSAEEFKTTIINVGGVGNVTLPPSTPFVNLSDLNTTFNLTHSTNVSISYQVGYYQSCGSYLGTRVLVDGVEVIPLRSIQGYFIHGTCSGNYILNLSAGNHTVVVQYRSGGCHTNIAPSGSDYMTKSLQIHILGNQ